MVYAVLVSAVTVTWSRVVLKASAVWVMVLVFYHMLDTMASKVSSK